VAYENIIVERDAGVGVVTLNRPTVLNALSRALSRELDEAITELETDDGVGAIIITGAGDKAFSAGADIHEMARLAEGADLPPEDPGRAGYAWHIASCTKPTIGAINGLAYGGGAVIAASLDMRVGSEDTSFRFLAASYGRVNSTWNLPQQIGWPMAKELLYTARVVQAREAHRIGLLNHLVAKDHLMGKAMELAKQIAANDPRMVAGIKQLVLSDLGASWEEMYRAELEAQRGDLSPTPIAEGFKDFLDRKGRS
jgi:enoyl-CoA hydratase/carnithine racemase